LSNKWYEISEQCTAMTPLIDQELEHVDKKHASLTAANQQLNAALNLYHSLMKESFATINSPYYGAQQHNTFSGGVHQFLPISQQNTHQIYGNLSNVSPSVQMPVLSQQMAPQSTAFQIPYSIQGPINGPQPQYVNSIAGQQTIPQQSFVSPISTAAVPQIDKYIKYVFLFIYLFIHYYYYYYYFKS
jgi:hypothetical protein